MNKQRGSSLPELILTLVFIGIAIPSLFAFFAYTSSNTVGVDIQAQALILAQDKLETISADRYDPTRGLNWVITPNRYPDELIDEFTRKVSVKEIVVNTIDGFQISVEVSHAGLSPYELSVFFTRY